MKNFLITVALALAASGAAFGVGYAVCCEPALHRAAAERDAMAWLRAEFSLDEPQFTAIKKLHDDYGIVCGEHCAAVMAAKQRNASPPEIAALEQTCVEAMTAHFRRVAALMPTPQGERYLATVLPRVNGYSHSAAPNVRVQP